MLINSKIIFINSFTFLLLLFSCTKTKKEYFPNGNKSYEVTLINGKKNGVETRWFETGIKQSEYTYINDTLNGKSTRWNFNGKVQSIDYYKNNLLNGISELFDDMGIKIIEKEYLNDTLSGIFKEWHTNGQIKTEGFYLKGFFDGLWTYYNTLGIVVGKAEFKIGSGTLTAYDILGKKIREVNYVLNQKHGNEYFFNNIGEIEKTIVYENGKIVNTFINN